VIISLYSCGGIFRFKVKVQVTDGKILGVFVLFDSEMSYIMEKSCAYFVAQSKVYIVFLVLLMVVVTKSELWLNY
jgi:uncharacterized membrane protein